MNHLNQYGKVYIESGVRATERGVSLYGRFCIIVSKITVMTSRDARPRPRAHASSPTGDMTRADRYTYGHGTCVVRRGCMRMGRGAGLSE